MIDLYFLNKKRKKNFFLIVVGLLIAGFLEAIAIGSIPIFVKLLTSPENLKNIFPKIFYLNFFFNLKYDLQILLFSTFIITSFIIKNIFVFYLLIYEGNFLKKLMVETSSTLFRQYLKMEYLLSKERNFSELLRNLTSQCESVKLYYHEIIFLIKEFVVCISILILLFFFSSFYAVLIFSFMFLISGLFFFIVSKKIKKKSTAIQELVAEQIKAINEGLNSIKEAKIYSKENMLFENFRDKLFNAEKLGVFSHVLNSTPKLLLEILAISSLTFVIIFLYFQEGSVFNALPVLSLLVVSLIRLLPSFNIINSYLVKIYFRKVSFKIIKNEINRLKFDNETIVDFENKHNVKALKTIKIKNISFWFSEEKKIINDLSINFESPKSIAILGNTGEGKSTLLDLMLGLIKPTAGDILINDSSIHKNLKSWHNKISYVAQKTFIFNDTIKNNILFGQDFNKDKFEKVIELSQLNKLIDNLKERENSNLGDAGTKLSGGEIQRIGIARSIYRDNDILIFDEATSSLDANTEKLIIESIFSLNFKFFFYVTHNLRCLEKFDLIFRLQNGKLIKVDNNGNDKKTL